MNEMANINDRRMKVSEVAEALGLSQDKVYRSAKELFPGAFSTGKTAYLDEAQVTALKYNLRKTAEVMAAPKTSLEKALLIRQAMQFQQEIIEGLQEENAELKNKIEADRPKVELAERALLSEDVLSLDTTAKSLKLPYGVIKFAARLREMAILKEHPKNIPYQQYVNQGYFVVDNVVRDCGGVDRVFPTARVTPKGLAWLSGMREKLAA